MFRTMRRKKQILSLEDSLSVLNNRTSGVLAVLGDDDYPYAVPMSYVYRDSKIFFHCAKSGHKLDAIMKYSKVSFCVIDCDGVVPEEYTTYFRSVIVFGKARILDDESEKIAAIEALGIKYHPSGTAQNLQKEIDKEYKLLCMLELSIEHMTGKEAMELVRKR